MKDQSNAGSLRWWVSAAALGVLAGACFTVGAQVHRHPLAGPTGTAARSPSATPHWPSATPTASQLTIPAAPKGAAPLEAARSTPVRLRIPAIGLSASLGSLGLSSDGTVQVPTNYQQPGWFQLGPSPGQVGSAVILGHVDSRTGPAVFFELRSLRPGDVVRVLLADGVTATFAVSTVVQYLKSRFPSRLVYASHGRSALQLITCGGVFDPMTGHYLSNIVVYTVLVATSRTAGSSAAAA